MRLLCRVLRVSASGFYAWHKRAGVEDRSRRDAALLEQVRAMHQPSRQTYGRARLLRALWAAGTACSAERLRRLMVKHGIFSKHRRKYRVATTDSRHALPVADNLLARRFAAPAQDRVWVADTTNAFSLGLHKPG